ncbi:hypothetical protein [Streptomyces sp. cg36]|uniref:hypothetical protein n=1 Tax=Streptomyces sp. cg36 TaxID=3238798 RepID=UPI0034E25293
MSPYEIVCAGCGLESGSEDGSDLYDADWHGALVDDDNWCGCDSSCPDCRPAAQTCAASASA